MRAHGEQVDVLALIPNACDVGRAAVEAAGANSEGLTSPPKSDSIGSGVTEEGEIAAVLGRMLDQAGRLDAYAANQVRQLALILSHLDPTLAQLNAAYSVAARSLP